MIEIAIRDSVSSRQSYQIYYQFWKPGKNTWSLVRDYLTRGRMLAIKSLLRRTNCVEPTFNIGIAWLLVNLLGAHAMSELFSGTHIFWFYFWDTKSNLVNKTLESDLSLKSGQGTTPYRLIIKLRSDDQYYWSSFVGP